MLWPEKKELSHIILPETKYVAIKVEQGEQLDRPALTQGGLLICPRWRQAHLPSQISLIHQSE